jgi:hypothetical protein
MKMERGLDIIIIQSGAAQAPLSAKYIERNSHCYQISQYNPIHQWQSETAQTTKYLNYLLKKPLNHQCNYGEC